MLRRSKQNVSDLDYFETASILGMDYLSGMDICQEETGKTVLRFDSETISGEMKKHEREVYLKKSTHKELNIEFSDWFYVEDGMYPDDYEMILVVMKNGSVDAGSVNTATEYLKEHPHGIIRQDRGGVIDYDSILCWTPLDNIKAF